VPRRRPNPPEARVGAVAKWSAVALLAIFLLRSDREGATKSDARATVPLRVKDCSRLGTMCAPPFPWSHGLGLNRALVIRVGR